MRQLIRTVIRRFGDDEGGQALADFALIMPMLFLLIAGILGFGRAYNLQQVVVDAAREGARAAVVQDFATADSTTGVAAVRHIINTRLRNAAVDTTTVTIDLAGSWRKTGDSMHVAVSVPYALPLLSVLMNWATGSPNFNLHSTTTMRNE
jgi:Flp pilus assembly protein TadG